MYAAQGKRFFTSRYGARMSSRLTAAGAGNHHFEPSSFHEPGSAAGIPGLNYVNLEEVRTK